MELKYFSYVIFFSSIICLRKRCIIEKFEYLQALDWEGVNSAPSENPFVAGDPTAALGGRETLIPFNFIIVLPIFAVCLVGFLRSTLILTSLKQPLCLTNRLCRSIVACPNKVSDLSW